MSFRVPTFGVVHNTFTFSETAVTINGIAINFDSNKSECDHSSYLGAETFPWVVAELIIDSALATTIASALSGYTELPMESCQTQAS